VFSIVRGKTVGVRIRRSTGRSQDLVALPNLVRSQCKFSDTLGPASLAGIKPRTTEPIIAKTHKLHRP
jgi:hypothetical protein